jgi:16S rRNA (uracil1498-N3)-methyltransferase
MSRFFVPAGTTQGDRVALPASIAHQVRRVLRLRNGASIVLLEGDGLEVVCRIDGDELIVIDRRSAAGEPHHRLTIVQALIKGDRLEEVIRHGTEIGVARFRLVVTDRCVARELSPRRLERLQAIAREAAEQSERGAVPAVGAPVPLADALVPGTALLLERHAGARLRELEPPLALAIGPEGGFAPEEVEAAQRAGAALAGLGPRILRSETVALAAAAVILGRVGDFA